MPSMRNGRPSLAFFDDWIICENKLISGSMSRENDHLYPTKQRDESRMKDYLCDRWHSGIQDHRTKLNNSLLRQRYEWRGPDIHINAG